MMEDILKLKASLQSPKEVVILSHRNPDGDAIGSSMACDNFGIIWTQCFSHFPKRVPSKF